MEKNQNYFSNLNQKVLAWFLIFLFSTSIITPNYSYAGGPDQPEVRGFTPISISDMVDPFTGDFTYNIPLMEIEGYPLNLAYHSGVGMDEEASWVGLGWSLHTGSLNRSMRGLPDDFNADPIEKTVSMKPITNIGLDLNIEEEIIGFNPAVIADNASSDSSSLGLNLNVGAGISFNSHTGIGVGVNFGPSFKFGESSSDYMTAGFSLSGSSENGSSFAPSVGMSSKKTKNDKPDKIIGHSLGTPMNTRAGLQEISYARSREKAGKPDRTRNASYDIGLRTYTPAPQPSFTGINFVGSLTPTGSFFGLDVQGTVAISYSRQWIPKSKKTIINKSYGYLHSKKGEENSEALLDFNRDNDVSFTKYSRALPSAFQTYDIFSINAQGVSGSFRPARNDVGYVFDPQVKTRSFNGNFGAEIGFGTAFDASFDIVLGASSTKTGLWFKRNNMLNGLTFLQNENGRLLKPYVWVDANEKSVDNNGLVKANFGGDNPVHYELSDNNPFTSNLNNSLRFSENSAVAYSTQTNKRSKSLNTNNQMYFLTNGETAAGMGVEPQDPLLSVENKAHHIGEITQLGMDGRRYVFGLPAYNYYQEDITFAIGSSLYGGTSGVQPDATNKGFVNISAQQFDEMASEDNEQGIDEYYSKTTTPSYAHSFMLTSILSDDYIDADNIQGPSQNDLGNYVKFSHTKVANHKWRNPMEEDKAFYNDGMFTNDNDDKASVVRGKKDIIYTKTIESKNQILVFVLDDRFDGKSIGENGGTETANGQKKLESIHLFNLNDYEQNGMNALSLQTVSFIYDYDLCKKYPGNANYSNPSNIWQSGKLSLQEIKFSYQGSNKMRDRSYKFDYSAKNPNYNLKSVDRWGTYKEDHPANTGMTDHPMTNAEFPYAEQDEAVANFDASAWHLTNITLPSGGKIKVTYEADHYGFVQHKKAARMYEILGTANSSLDTGSPEKVHVSSSSNANQSIFFKFSDPSHSISDYALVGQQLYFRCLVDFVAQNAATGNKCEYVSGYAEITKLETHTSGGNKYGEIFLEPEKLKDNGSKKYSPITKAAILFGRLHLARYINNAPVLATPNGSANGFTDFLTAAVQAYESIGELVTGPNIPIYNDGKGVELVTKKSFIRLVEPTGKKIGGGSRVAKIEMSDEWNEMGTNSDAFTYGQEYRYESEDGKSYGVASYEPQLGGDENPFRTAYVVNNKKRFATDDQLFVEDPIMESQFPSPQVGYSRVEIKNLSHPGVVRTATGKVVKEFYTARDFPTVVSNSNIQIAPKNNLLPIGPKYQLLNATQGFVIELNDMHGKQKKEMVFAENADQPLSSVEYRYQKTPLNLDGVLNYKLDNTIQTINKTGDVETSEIGVRYDAVADFRESNNKSVAVKTKLGVNGILIFVVIPVPSWWPKIDVTQNRFRSSTLNKTVNRFGIVEEVIANQDGSIVSTKNSAYDAETGAVLLTETKTNFEDDIYSMDYPAYWNHKEFDRASKNIMYDYTASQIQTNGFTSIPPSKNHFQAGDEVRAYFLNYNSYQKAWVSEKNASGIVLIDKSGVPLSGSNVALKVIRSGYRNKQGTSMASMVTLKNPLNTIKTNGYSEVLNASAIQYSDAWKTYCSCFDAGVNETTNPYVLGTKGNLRPWRSYTYLSERTQSNYNGNTNIRKDGVFSGYTPFYKLTAGNWEKDGNNWTYVSEVTEFSPNGMTLETKDALGRHSTNAYGFNGTLTTGTAVNSKMTDFAVAALEDAGQNSCNDESFFSKQTDGNAPPIADQGHTGRKSIEVAPNSTVSFENVKDPCAAVPACNLSPEFLDNSNIVFTGAKLPSQMEILSSNGAYAYMVASNELEYSFTDINDEESFITIKVTDEKGCEKVFTLYPIEQGNNVGDGFENTNLITGTQSVRFKAPNSLIEMNINF